MPPKPAPSPAAPANQPSRLKSPLLWTLLVLALALLYPLSTYYLAPPGPTDAALPPAPAPPAAAVPSMAIPPPAGGDTAPPAPVAAEADLPMREFTKATLAPFNGLPSTTNPASLIYLAILGRVYDVSSGRRFYGPAGAYNTFAGRDATPALAKNRVLKPEGEEDEAVGEEGWRRVLSGGEWESVGRWEGGLAKKYKVVGVLV